MWLDKLFSTVLYIKKPVFCEKHESPKNVSKEVKKQCQEIFCVLAYIRKCVMDPFYYNTPYPPAVIGACCENLEKLPWKSSMTWDQLEEDTNLVQLAYDIATYTLASLTKVCVFCEKSKNCSSVWVNNTKEDTDLWHRMKENNVNLENTLSCSSQYQKILDRIYSFELLPSENNQFVDTVFFVTFMLRYSVFSSESVESILASNQKIMEHTKKFTLEFPIGENHLEALEPLSQQLTTLKGPEKESFSMLLELVKRAVTSLRFENYEAAKVYSHAIVTLAPSWCKGYFFLATAVYHIGKRIHYSHEVASHGIAVCDSLECSTCVAFMLLVQKWKQECDPVCQTTVNTLVDDEFKRIGDYKRVLSEVSQKRPIPEADDLPELTDPSGSEGSNAGDSDYDEGEKKTEKPEVSLPLPVPEVKQVKPEQNSEKKESPVKKQSPVKKVVPEQKEASESKQKSSDIKQVNGLKENDTPPSTRQTPLKKVVPEQKEASESKQKSSDIKQVNGLKENDTPPPTRQSPLKKQPSFEQGESTKSQQKVVQEVDSKPTKANSKEVEKARRRKELVDARLSVIKANSEKVEKARQRKELSDAILSVMEVQEKMERLRILLKEGSAAITDGCGLSAVRNFYDALTELKSNPTIYEFEEYEIVCIKYAYGSACIKSGTCEDLNKAIAVFNEILNDHSNIRFPVAYYGLGLVHYKLNMFKEALSHFETLQSILNKGIHCTVYSWPGTVHAIEETKTEKLKVLLRDLMDKCRSPPEPAAVCRFENCSSRPEIYYSDPDFKGFTIIQCQDRCILQYHPTCWKSLKDSYDRTDKDFLGQQCLTPDCEFIVMQIECIGKDGTREKHFEIEDPEKVKKHKKSRLEKRLVMKEQKKRRRLESQSTPVTENSEVCDTSEAASETASNVSDQPVVKEEENNEVFENEPPKKIESNLSVNAKPFYAKKDAEPVRDNPKACYMWKKDDSGSICSENEKVSKTKERKKTKKPAPISLEEFRQKFQDFSFYNEYQIRLSHLQQSQDSVEDKKVQWSTICETENIPHLDPSRPFYIPENLRDDPQALDAVLQSYCSFGKKDFSKILKEKIYLHMEKMLGFYGPMRLNDPLLLEEVAEFPSSFQKMISDAGGLKDFLLASVRFAFVGDHICNVSDVVKAYSIESKSYNGEGYSSALERLNEYDDVPNDVIDEDDLPSENSKFHSMLNPNAREYNPFSPVQSKSGSFSSGNSNSSSEAYQNDVGVKEVDEDSPVGSSSALFCSPSKPREPLLLGGQNCNGLTRNDNTTENASHFADPDFAFDDLSEDIRKLPCDRKFDIFLKILKFLLNDEYFAEFMCLFGHQLKPYTFTVISKKYNKCLQAGTPGINMHSVGVMKEDDDVKVLVENFRDLERFRNNINEEKKIIEEKLEHSLDTVAQLQNALAVAEKNIAKKVEEVQAALEEEKKEFRKKEKNWEKEQKRLELNQTKMTEQVKNSKEEIKNYREELIKKDAILKETEELKKAAEINLAKISKDKVEIEASLREALLFHEVEVAGLAKKLQDAQLEVLTMKKNTVLEKISLATKNAELRLKEIQDGLPLVHPLISEKFKSLQAQIKEHIIKLAKIHCDFVKAADEQIKELKKGKDISDLDPLAEPSLSECPTLNIPQNPTNMAQSPPSLSPESPTSHLFPDMRSLGFMMQAPSSTSVPSSGQMFGSLLNSFPQKTTASHGAHLSGASVVGTLPGVTGSPIPSVKPYSIQKANIGNSIGLYDGAIFPNSMSGYIQKPVPNFPQGLSKAPMPPGLGTSILPSSQGLHDIQGSDLFRMPSIPQQNTANQPLLPTPFSFGFPQLHKTELNASGKAVSKNTENSAAESNASGSSKSAITVVERKSPVDFLACHEKSVSKESICETKNNISGISQSDSILLPVGKVSRTNSTCSSPVPLEPLSRDRSLSSISSCSTPVTVPELSTKPSSPLLDLEATGVKPKKPKASAKHRKTSVSSQSGASSVASDYDPFNLDGSVPENAALELGYTVKEHNEPARPKPILSPTSNVGGFAKAVAAQPKDVPATNSYEKLLTKLMNTYPQYSRNELINCVGEFRRSHNNKLSNLKFGSIISGIGELLKKQKSIAQATQASTKKKPQLQVVSLTKKPTPPPVSEKSGVCPWAKQPGSENASAPWHGNSSDTSCSICLEEMTVKSSVKKLECGHRFHTMCLKEWLDKNSNCPICRIHVLLPEDYPSLS